jgi:hypothetical protein
MCFRDQDEVRLDKYHKKMARQYCYYDEMELGKKPGGHGAPNKPNVIWAIPNEYGEDEFTDIYLCGKCKAAWEAEGNEKGESV